MFTNIIEFISDDKDELPSTLPPLIVFNTILFIENCSHMSDINHPPKNLDAIITTRDGLNEFHGCAASNTAKC